MATRGRECESPILKHEALAIHAALSFCHSDTARLAARTAITDVSQEPSKQTESLSSSPRTDISFSPPSPSIPPPQQPPLPPPPAPQNPPPVETVTAPEVDTKESEPTDIVTVVPGRGADKVRQETMESGHGVASDPKFQERQPIDVPDPDKVKEEDHLLDRCAYVPLLVAVSDSTWCVMFACL